jgi:hypothetical protein
VGKLSARWRPTCQRLRLAIWRSEASMSTAGGESTRGRGEASPAPP